jgi:hypothetical protein
MKKTYTYNEIKGFINEELENFNHIIESKHIFNAEFNKYRKFFKWITKKVSYVKDEKYDDNTSKWIPYKRPIHPAFDTYNNYGGRFIRLTKENVVDLDMTQLYKDFPNLKKDQELLLSLKPNVRSGKRPKNLEKDYEAERLRKAQLEDKATCGICHDYWEQVDMNGEKNIIADHGFFIGFGQRNDVCFGARFHAWEKSPKVKIEYVKKVLRPALAKVIKQEPTLKTVKYVNDLIVEKGNEFKAYYNLSYNEQKETDRPTKPEYKLSGQQIGVVLPLNKEIDLEFLTKIWYDWKIHLKTEITRFETAIKNWKLQPTPKERANDNTKA